jgi:hypothetical protein
MGILDFFFGVKPTAAVSLRSGRGWTVDVVGESNYQSALGLFYRRGGGKGSDLKCEAQLMPDDGNLHDSNAVSVRIAGVVVGYLPRDMAKEYRARIAELPHLAGPATCSAKIIGGHRLENGETAHFGVKLNMTWPPLLA